MTPFRSYRGFDGRVLDDKGSSRGPHHREGEMERFPCQSRDEGVSRVCLDQETNVLAGSQLRRV